MWIGTYAIDDYQGNGGGVNLGESIAGADAFWDAANAYSSLAYRFTIRENEQVTRLQLSNNPRREYADFVYFDGHGVNDAAYLGADPDYGFVDVTDMAHGTSYNRWVYYYACSMLESHHTDPGLGWIIDRWEPAFRGVQVVLGYGSGVWAVSYKDDIHNDFWDRWTTGEGIWDAHQHSVFEKLYNGVLGVEPAVLGSIPSHGPIRYFCDDSYDEATSEEGVHEIWQWARRVCGTPIY